MAPSLIRLIVIYAATSTAIFLNPTEAAVLDFFLRGRVSRRQRREGEEHKGQRQQQREENPAAAVASLISPRKSTANQTENNKSKDKSRNKNTDNNMGQAIRMMSYDYAGNQKNAVTALRLLGNGETTPHDLSWFRLDDGVMGGRSSTNHDTVAVENNDKKSAATTALHFAGTINTDGGGFCSIRANLPPGYLTTSKAQDYALKLRYQGDGKTYKVLLSDGKRGGPMSSSPSWQYDLPTTTSQGASSWQEQTIPLSSFVPSFAGSRRSTDDFMKYDLHPNAMREIGFMLSLRLADGKPNPVETFGEGVFPFSLKLQSIEIVPK